jgi:hypothetical protein
MKKFFLLAVSVCALAGLSVAGVASADNGATTTQFKASYQLGDAAATCSGVNVYKTAPKAFNKDSETCQLSGDDGFFPVGTSVWGYGVWISDSGSDSHSYQQLAQSFTATKTLNADGVTYTLSIVANYAV